MAFPQGLAISELFHLTDRGALDWFQDQSPAEANCCPVKLTPMLGSE